MCIYIYIKQKFCTLIPGFPRFRERKLCWNALSKMDFFSHSLISKKVSKGCGVRCELFFYSFSYPSWLMVVRSWPGFFFVLLLLIFIFQVNFVTSDALWEKWTFFFFFCCCDGKKEKCEHGAAYARHGNFFLLNMYVHLGVELELPDHCLRMSQGTRSCICCSNMLPETSLVPGLPEICLFALVYF